MSRADVIREALERGESDAQLLGGRNFNARYWQNARRQFNNLVRELDAAESERDSASRSLDLHNAQAVV